MKPFLIAAFGILVGATFDVWFGPNCPAFDLGYSIKTGSGKTAWVTLGEEFSDTFTLNEWNYRVIGNTSQNPDLLKGI